ncbi:MAG: hypothetical protein LC114_14005 [Bryobacterales bacterium]|nr:hypothetical protein [Bryobacterales bacterium]
MDRAATSPAVLCGFLILSLNACGSGYKVRAKRRLALQKADNQVWRGAMR